MSRVYFNGPEGRIEGMYAKAPSSNAPLVIILHPHPLQGGDMHNTVEYLMLIKQNEANKLKTSF